eukprot:6316102-Amphidinium_carterae.2
MVFHESFAMRSTTIFVGKTSYPHQRYQQPVQIVHSCARSAGAKKHPMKATEKADANATGTRSQPTSQESAEKAIMA